MCRRREYFSARILYKKSFTHSIPIAFDFNINLVHIISRLYCSGGSPVMAQRLCAGLDLKAPVASLSAVFCIVSRSLRLVGLADE